MCHYYKMRVDFFFFILKGKHQRAEVRPDVFLLGRSETTHCQHVHELGLRKYLVERLPQINHIRMKKPTTFHFYPYIEFLKNYLLISCHYLAISLPQVCVSDFIFTTKARQLLPNSWSCVCASMMLAHILPEVLEPCGYAWTTNMKDSVILKGFWKLLLEIHFKILKQMCMNLGNSFLGVSPPSEVKFHLS